MKKKTLFARYLLAKPTIRGLFEWIVLGASGISGYYFSMIEIPNYRYFLVSGIILLILGVGIHGASHAVHRQALDRVEAIKGIVTRGMYSKIRHPCYVSLILIYMGFAFIWGSLLPIIVAIILSFLLVLVAIKEEEYLLEKFEKEYKEYMRRVPWRFIPKLF